MPMLAATFFCGLLFGAGLMLSEMSQPAKVLNFLDLFGTWDPSLAFVMAGALAVSAAGYALARRSGQPLFGRRHLWPTKAAIDPPLIFGATLFGVGWGLVGLCPGPALVNLATLSPQVIVFVVCMVTGMLLQHHWQTRRNAASATATSADG
jgi:hypothetical protein